MADGTHVNMARMDAIRVLENKKTKIFDVQVIKADGAGEWVVFHYGSDKHPTEANQMMNEVVDLLTNVEMAPFQKGS